MKIKTLILAVVETIIKVVILAFAIMFIFKGITKAYDFGYKVFADEPVSANNGRTISVGIAEGSDVEDVAAMLEEKGLIKDARLFVVQEYLSAYHDKIIPGIYDLSTDMKAAQMLAIISTPQEEADAPSENNIVSEDSEPAGEETEETETEETEGAEETEEIEGEGE